MEFDSDGEKCQILSKTLQKWIYLVKILNAEVILSFGMISGKDYPQRTLMAEAAWQFARGSGRNEIL